MLETYICVFVYICNKFDYTLFYHGIGVMFDSQEYMLIGQFN